MYDSLDVSFSSLTSFNSCIIDAIQSISTTLSNRGETIFLKHEASSASSAKKNYSLKNETI